MPALLVFDGDYCFDDAVRAARRLHAEGPLDGLLVAGVGYGRPFGDRDNHRGRDYTPTASVEEPASGGAAAFLEHVAEKIIPAIEGRYRIDRERSAFAGHSLSGLFVLFALLQERPVARRAIIGAPSIWWDDRALLKQLGAFRDRHASLRAEVFIGVGEDETPSMLGDLELLEAQLRARPFAQLALAIRRFPGRTHYDLTPDLFAAGVRELFAGPRRRGS